jgi:hypothetical protein
MTILPIFLRDFRSSRQRLRHDRLVAGGIAALLLLVLAGIDRWSPAFNLVRFLKTLPLESIAPYLLLLVGISLGGNLLSPERREGMLPLLLLTRLTGCDILLGKLLMALVIEFNTLLAVVPAMILPLTIAGFKGEEIALLVLGCGNVVFFGLVVGLFSAVFFDEGKAMVWGLTLVLAGLLLATPFAALIPIGPLRECLRILRPFNPGEALAHVQTVVGGFRSGSYWMPLVVSHLTSWGLLGVGGISLARACRGRAGRDAGSRRRRWVLWSPQNRSVVIRRRLLNRNPFLWLASRYRWATIQVWVYLSAAVLLWSWLIWLTWAVRGVNVTIVPVIGLAVSWMVQFLVSIPAEASRRLVEDRQSGALEMLLCTPLSVERIIQGQWLALGRRYLPPFVVTAILSLALMLAGYFSYGFGGMLEPEDRPVWIITWLAGIGLQPLALTAVCWVAMHRTFNVRNAGDATGLALLQVVGLPCLALAAASVLLHLLIHRDPNECWNVALFVLGLVAAQVGFGWRARRLVLRNLRQAAANRDR